MPSRQCLILVVLCALRLTESGKKQTEYINGRVATCLSFCNKKENPDNKDISKLTAHGHDDPCIYYYQFKDDVLADDELNYVARKLCECMQCVEDEPICKKWKKKHAYTLTCTGDHEGKDGMILPEHYLTLKGKEGWKHFLKNHAKTANPLAHHMKIRKAKNGDPDKDDVLIDMKKGPKHFALLKQYTGCVDPCPEDASPHTMHKCCTFMLRKCCYGEEHCEDEKGGYLPASMDLTKYAFKSGHCIGIESNAPTTSPTAVPTPPPSLAPTQGPTHEPTLQPSAPPSKPPTLAPSPSPTSQRCRCVRVELMREHQIRSDGADQVEADALKELPPSSDYYAVRADNMEAHWTYAQITKRTKDTLILYYDQELGLWIVGYDMIPGHFLLAVPSSGNGPEYIPKAGVEALDHRKQKVRVRVECRPCPTDSLSLQRAQQGLGVHFATPGAPDSPVSDEAASPYAAQAGSYENHHRIASGRRRRAGAKRRRQR